MSSKISRRSLARYAADQLLGGSSAKSVARHLAAALISSRSQKDGPLLLDDINYELQNRGYLASVTVTSARPLSASSKNQIASLVKKLAQVRQVILAEQIDKAVIGGVRIQTADRTWDKTVSTELNKLKENI
ncbi:MAG TPA: F0F1 ATP synthase subunit delta [Candidatus Saccharimonadales bacterium]|nr:F0F1 ATP synthase subunit delta [Candidatus Saccharimonadales bacterium]